jgi:anaerobic magnesium-protoporphyrin IX monomethyl ester cyclase
MILAREYKKFPPHIVTLIIQTIENRKLPVISSKLNVLFVFPNVNGTYQESYSFGLAAIVSMTKESGYNSKVVYINTRSGYQDVLSEIATFRPQVVGFSSVSSQFNYVTELAKVIKKNNPHIITVCGGVHSTINPACILECKYLDGVFVGESDYAFIEFLEKVENRCDYKDTDNFAYSVNGKLVKNKLKPLITNLDILPFPDKEMSPYREYVEWNNFTPFIFTRGCPYLCSYCSNHAIAETYGLQRNTSRYRSPELCVSEIEKVINMIPTKLIYISDEVFGLNRKWRDGFLAEYKRRINKKFMCLLRVDVVSDEFINDLREAGCCQISFGIESGNDYVRKEIMHRNMSNKQIIKAFDVVHKYGIRTSAINIIGVPGETEEMIRDTIRLNRMIKPTVSGVNIFYPYKGTKLGDKCFKEGLVNEELYYSFSKERSETVLKYPEEFKEKLIYYKQYWHCLVYPYNIKYGFKRLLLILRVWSFASILKRRVLNILKAVQKQ